MIQFKDGKMNVIDREYKGEIFATYKDAIIARCSRDRDPEEVKSWSVMVPCPKERKEDIRHAIWYAWKSSGMLANLLPENFR